MQQTLVDEFDSQGIGSTIGSALKSSATASLQPQPWGVAAQLTLSWPVRLINQIKLHANYDENLYRSLRPQVGSVAWRCQASIAVDQLTGVCVCVVPQHSGWCVCSQPRKSRELSRVDLPFNMCGATR